MIIVGPIFLYNIPLPKLAIWKSLIVATAWALTSCETADTKVAKLPQQLKNVKNSLHVPKDWKFVGGKLGFVQENWAQSFNDPILTKLINEAISNNRDISKLRANKDRARAMAKRARSILHPIINAFTSSNTVQNSSDIEINRYDFGLEVSWELDVWDRLQHSEQAAELNFLSIASDYKYAQSLLAAEVAKAYFSIVEARTLEILQEKILVSLIETNRVVQIQFDYGVANQQDLSLIMSDVSRAKNNLSVIKNSKRNFERVLEVLLGRYPGAEVTTNERFPVILDLPPTGIPIDILTRRPDLIAANFQILSSYEKLMEADMESLPKITLSGVVGNSSQSLSNVLNFNDFLWQVASEIVYPVFDGGKNKALFDLRSAEFEAAIENYAISALNAYKETEGAIDMYQTLKARKLYLEEAVQEAGRALKVAELRFEVGESDLLDVLTFQQRVFSFEAELISLEKQQLDSLVDLNLAVGGNW